MRTPKEKQERPTEIRALTDKKLDHVSGGYQSGGSNGTPVVHDTFSLNFAHIRIDIVHHSHPRAARPGKFRPRPGG